MNKQVIKNIIISVFCMLLLMSGAFMFRLFTHNKTVSEMGEEYIDPETELPYLTEMDSYYHLRMTKDIAETGVPGGGYKDGEAWDSLSYAPYGRSAAEYKPLMADTAVFAKKLISQFKTVSIEQVAYWLGAVLSVLIVIPVFIMAFKLGGFIPAIIAAFLASVNYGYFVHTTPGFYDTDNVLSVGACLFFLSALLLAGAFKKDDEGKKRYVSKALSVLFFALTLGLLIFSWSAYALFVGILAASSALYLIAAGCLGGKNGVKRSYLIPVLIHFISFVLVLILDRAFFGNLIAQFMSVFAGGKGIFPDAYVSVSEMRKPALTAGGLTGLFQMKVLSGKNIGVLNAVGGIVPSGLALAMCIMLIKRMIKKKDARFDHILLVVWYFVSFILAFRSWRFIMLFAVPVAILAGMFAGWLIGLMREKKMMDYPVYAAMLILLIIFPALYGVYRSTGDSRPSVSRSLHEGLANIRDNSSENVILASWWDLGYFYEEKAERRTVFDGGSQNGIRVYWMGKALSTTDERLSKNILRMIAGEGDTATDELIAEFGEDQDTLSFMTALLSGTREEAVDELKGKGISLEEAERLGSLLFPETEDEILLLITPDMFSISNWFYTFGTWGEEGVDEDDYSVLFSPSQVDMSRGEAAWRFNGKEQPFDLVLKSEDGRYEAHTRAVNDGDAIPVVDRVVIREGGMMFNEQLADVSDNDTGIVVYLEIRGDEDPMMTVMTDELYDSVFGKLFFGNTEDMQCFRSSAYGNGYLNVYSVQP